MSGGTSFAGFTAPAGPGVDFGAGSVRRLPELIDGAAVFVVTDPGLRAAGVLERVLEPLCGHEVHVFDEVPGNPGTDVVRAGTRRLRAFAGDRAVTVLALGGGSSMDAAKGMALLAVNPGCAVDGSGTAPACPGLPLLAVPTTAGTGAETNGFGVLDDPVGRRKVYCGDASVTPRHTVLDPELTLGLPVGVTAATGVDALVHGVESLTSRGRNEFSRVYAAEAVRLAWRWLPAVVADGADLAARSAMLLAAHLAGRALTLSGLGLVHGLGHAVTAHTGAVHGHALAAVLPEVVAASLNADEAGYAEVAAAIGVRPAGLPEDLADLLAEVRVTPSIGDLGCRPAMLSSVAAAALADPVSRNAPHLPDAADLVTLLTRCGPR